MFTSSKRIGPISTGHRQWKDKGHCSFVHGYGRYVEFTFACDERDEKGWVMDFGDLRDVKKWLEDEWDHRLLLAHDDPLLEEFKKIDKIGGCNLNIMPKGYDDPKEIIDFIEKYIDYDQLFEGQLKKKISMFYDALEWSLPIDKKNTLERFF